MKPIFSIITESQVRNVAFNNHESIYALIKKAYRSHYKKETVNPPSYFLRYPDKPNSRIIALPASITYNPRIGGIKWIASNPDNIKKGLNRASAVIILNDYETGYPFSCIEGSLISTIRTAYSAVVAADKLMINKNINVVGILGTGKIAFNILRYLCLQNYNIDSIILHDLLEERVEKFIWLLKENNIKFSGKILIKNRKEDLVNESNLLILITTTNKPYIDDLYKIKNDAIILHISLRDIMQEVLVKCNNIVDDIDHVRNASTKQANTSPHLALQKYVNIDFINGTIGQLIANEITIDRKKTTIVSPMGLGILNIALANFIYRETEKNHDFIKIKDFFE
ncbi:MAG: 2,3-diaminopropionate biosynthesis protein SbnB [Proteobacteria bacterium]|nr:2,3-diaminopropionate biosynthesis protein SbnB [Pseudomonadota bacterium]